MYTYESIHEPKQFTYDVAESIKEHAIRYFFISEGERNLLKMIEYSLLEEESDGRKLFNFGFGDYNSSNGTIADQVLSNNKDVYKVFNTVLSTIPRFFKIHSNAILMVKGSDSSIEFVEICRTGCRKNCSDICRNVDRRISIYRGYINKHFDTLKTDYTIYGGLDRADNKITLIDYIPGIKQESIILIKNKNQQRMKTEENQTQELMEPTSAEEMIALAIEQTKDIIVFARQHADAKEYLKRLGLPDNNLKWDF